VSVEAAGPPVQRHDEEKPAPPSDLMRRVSWLERQHRMLLIALAYGQDSATTHRGLDICVDSRCQNGPVPHMAEQPHGCPRLTA
jgi:hypothetical protein